MNVPLTQAELNIRGCPCGKCGGEMYFHGACHPNAHLTARYVAETGVLTLLCVACGRVVAPIAVSASAENFKLEH